MDKNATRGILFDLDGTLVDSAPDLAAAVNVMMTELGLPVHSEASIRNWIGKGVAFLVRQALTHTDGDESKDDLFALGFPIFNHAYEQGICDRSTLYPGVKDALVYFKAKKYTMGCVTNKPEYLAKSLLHGLSVSEYFTVIVGGDTLAQKKPDPAVLRYAAEQLDLPLQTCIMVGDSTHDVQAAHAAGIRIICVSYGYNHGSSISESTADAVVDNFSEIAGLLPTVGYEQATRSHPHI